MECLGSRFDCVPRLDIMFKTYFSYRRQAKLTVLASLRGQLHSWKLNLRYASSNFKIWWFWHVSTPFLKRTNPAKFKERMDRMKEALIEFKELMEK